MNIAVSARQSVYRCGLQAVAGVGVMLWLAFSNAALAMCWTMPVGSSETQNFATYTTHSVRPFNSVGVGEVFATAQVNIRLYCHGWERAEQVIQIQPRAASVLGGNVCETPIDGVGVRFRDRAGTPINCNGWSAIASVWPQAGEEHDMSYPAAAEFIRTKAVSSAPPGPYTLRMPANAQLLHHLYGVNNSTYYGRVDFNPGAPFIISSCLFANPTTEVDFGSVTLAEVATTQQPFEVEINRCTDQANAQLFNDAMSIEFQSPRISVHGNLENDSCSTCAGNLAVQITDDRGVVIQLNDKYSLRNGTFTVNGETITHRFVATLRSTGAAVTAGDIRASVTMVFTSM